MALILRNFLYFLKRKVCYISGSGQIPPPSPHPPPPPPEKKEEKPYIPGDGNPKKLLIFQEVTFRAQQIKKAHSEKKLLMFQEMELSSPKPKKLLIFQEELPKSQKRTKNLL